MKPGIEIQPGFYIEATLGDQLKYLAGVVALFGSFAAASYVAYKPHEHRILRTTKTVPVVMYTVAQNGGLAHTLAQERSPAFSVRDSKATLHDTNTDTDYAFSLDQVVESLNPSERHGRPLDILAAPGTTLRVPDFDGDGKVGGVACAPAGSITFSGAYDHTDHKLLDTYWTVQK